MEQKKRNNDKVDLVEWFEGLDDNFKTTFLMFLFASVSAKIMRQILDTFFGSDKTI